MLANRFHIKVPSRKCYRWVYSGKGNWGAGNLGQGESAREEQERGRGVAETGWGHEVEHT